MPRMRMKPTDASNDDVKNETHTDLSTKGRLQIDEKSEQFRHNAPSTSTAGIASASLGSGRGPTAEHERLSGPVEALPWRLWGPYLSERQWGTVREDYSDDGNCWEHFPHSDAPWRAYQWGEDGLMGVSDEGARLCLALSLWNGRDSILKERLYGLTGPQGNHGEDVKECYFYVDATPSHSYMKMVYKYPQKAFPYDEILTETHRRGLKDPEYELMDTGVFTDGSYWDVTAEYAKDDPRAIYCRYTVTNRSQQSATIHVLPTLWFRNTWSWKGSSKDPKPIIQSEGDQRVSCFHEDIGEYCFEVLPEEGADESPVLLFTENDTNEAKMRAVTGPPAKKARLTCPGKDAFHDYVINGDKTAVNLKKCGTKMAAHHVFTVAPGASSTVRCRLAHRDVCTELSSDFDKVFAARQGEANEFYSQIVSGSLSEAETAVARQAYAGLCWTKQFFGYDVSRWFKGNRKEPAAINGEWGHMVNNDVISMPDKWEFPWYATWDLAFHMVPFADIDPEFAKSQLLLFLSDRYMHPNGQLPAYEFNFSDVNPPVHAWACLKVYERSRAQPAGGDLAFLKKVFHKLSINFNWWVNKKDRDGSHVFQGGFLGMDNISCVDRSHVPPDALLDQVDGTSWMAFYSVCMLRIALELAHHDNVYEDMAVRYLQHFAFIADAVNSDRRGLWDTTDEFYYDRLTTLHRARRQIEGAPHSTSVKTVQTLRVRSLVGLSALFPAFVLDVNACDGLPDFRKALEEFKRNRGSCKKQFEARDGESRLLLSVPDRDQLTALLRRLVDESEFLSRHGIRALSKYHEENPASCQIGKKEYSVAYAPGESNTDMFGGNSNWRGPIWLCMNFLLLESLDQYDHFYGEALTVEYPSDSGRQLRLCDVGNDVRKRLTSIFLPDAQGHRPLHGKNPLFAEDPGWKDLVLFYEYFHGDTGRGCGASHQTGWTALVASVLNHLGHIR